MTRTFVITTAILLLRSTAALSQTCEADLALCRQQLGDSEQGLVACFESSTQLAAEVLELEGFRDAYFTETYDADGDGLADGRDRCPHTDANLAVDADGCSLGQFCNELTTATVRDRQTCRRLDWKNDEPRTGNPGDCRADGGACVAAVAEPRATACVSIVARVGVGFAGLAAGISVRVEYPPAAVEIPGFGSDPPPLRWTA